MRENFILNIIQLLKQLDMEAHAAHYANVFSNHRTTILEQLSLEEAMSLEEYLKKYASHLKTPAEKL